MHASHQGGTAPATLQATASPHPPLSVVWRCSCLHAVKVESTALLRAAAHAATTQCPCPVRWQAQLA